jgi:RimK family alpha-L-glutamate ligase
VALPNQTSAATLSPTLFAVVAQRSSATNVGLVQAGWPGASSLRLTAADALALLGPGDVALTRLDVLQSLDGVEEGIEALSELAARGVRVLNPPDALLCAHDKLLTARALERSGLPHPRTRLHLEGGPLDAFTPPVVVKPRFGSWGKEVRLCADRGALERTLQSLSGQAWFHRQGAILQELIPPRGFDLRVLVSGGQVVGAIERRAAPGEWRTNVQLGGTRHRIEPPPAACALALSAASAAGLDLVGVDLLPSDEGWQVVELNGAVDFTRDYRRDRDVFEATVDALVTALAKPEPDIAVVPA